LGLASLGVRGAGEASSGWVAPAGHGRPAERPQGRRAKRGPVNTTGAPASHEGAGSGNYLVQLHFWVPDTVVDDDAPPWPFSAVNVTLYGRLPPLHATDVP